MFHKQIGFRPFIAFIVGLFISIFAVSIMLYGLRFLYGQWIKEGQTVTIFPLLLLVFAYLYFLWMGIIIMDLFPAIKIDEAGITVKNLLSVDLFGWDEVKGVRNTGGVLKGSKAITLQIQGSLLINFIKYYPYFMRGQIAMLSLEPVIILSDSLADRKMILEEIGHQVQNHLKIQPKTDW